MFELAPAPAADTGSPPRPDRDRGVFETLLILDDEPVELDAHLARLRNSVKRLYGQALAPGLADRLREQSRGLGRGKARVIATSSGVTVESKALTGEFLGDRPRNSPTAVSLHSLELPGGLGPHKWADRSLLEEAEAGLPDEGLVLIVDPEGGAAGDDTGPNGGTVLEASRANLFAVRAGTLLTPPLDGRLLPGVTRARVLALAAETAIEVREAPLARADLHGADEVFLTGSVRGVEPVAMLDGRPLGRDDRISAALADALERAWRGSRAPVG